MKKIGVTLSLFASLKETREIKWCNDKIGRVTDRHLSKWSTCYHDAPHVLETD